MAEKFQYQAAELSGEDLNDEEEDAAAEKAAEADELAALKGDEEEKGNGITRLNVHLRLEPCAIDGSAGVTSSNSYPFC